MGAIAARFAMVGRWGLMDRLIRGRGYRRVQMLVGRADSRLENKKKKRMTAEGAAVDTEVLTFKDARSYV